jgi:hypothetical protein
MSNKDNLEILCEKMLKLYEEMEEEIKCRYVGSNIECSIRAIRSNVHDIQSELEIERKIIT